MMSLIPLLGLLACQSPYVLAVGVNNSGVDDLAPLKYADDDAAEAVALFFGEAGGERAFLHTVMDKESQQRYAKLTAQAQPPSRKAIGRSVQKIQTAVKRDLQAGHKPVVFVWLSGHAAYDKAGHAYYPLLDGRLNTDSLRSEIIEPLSDSHRVHLIVDTCFAASLVRSRMRLENVTPEAVKMAFWERGAFVHPNVGAVVGATAGARAYEWEEVGAGIFSAMVRAGLRGAADIDGDGVVRYSELEAFLLAAGASVQVREARPKVRSHPPAIDVDAVFSQKDWLPDVATLSGDFSQMGTMHVLDENGAWLLAGHFESGYRAQLWLPTTRQLFLRLGSLDRPLLEERGVFQIGEAVEQQTQPRSLVGHALRKGLFATPFGPAFFRGYLAANRNQEAPVAPDPKQQQQAFPRAVVWGVAATAGGLALVLGGLSIGSAVAFVQTDKQRDAMSYFATSALAGGVANGFTLLAISAAGLALFVDNSELEEAEAQTEQVPTESRPE